MTATCLLLPFMPLWLTYFTRVSKNKVRDMLVLISSAKLGFEFTLNQSHHETLEGLREAFIEKEGREIYSKAAKIVVVEEHFYNVVKDRYGPSLIGEHIDNLDNLIDAHLNV